MPGRATIHEVARELGVAASTVSRAFNSPHLLRPETVARITAAAELMGYVPNRYARALVTGRTGLLGLVVPDVTNPFFPPMVRAAQRAAESRDLVMLVVESDSTPERERTHIASLVPHCEGIIVASSRLTAEELRHVAESTRLVLVNNDTEGVARVLVSSADALREGIEGLVRGGARRFLYVGGPHRSWSEHERRSTVENTTAAHGLTTMYARDESGTYDEARRLFRDGVGDVDAVVAFDDVIACGVLDGLHDQDVDVPGQVRVLGCDDALTVRTRPRLSTIALRSAEGVTEAVRLVTSAAEETVPEERIVLPGELCLRETT